VQKRLNTEVNKVLADKDVQERLSKLDNIVSPASVEQFSAQVQREYEANARVIKDAGIKLE
jgi:tripartite-type tricarboxylate transporter receptor subunit TctC